MATSYSIMAAIQANLNTAISGIVVNNLPIDISTGIGWPPLKALQNNVQQNRNSIISIYDRKMARNTTRWNPINLSRKSSLAALISALSSNTVVKSGSATLTMENMVNTGDAVSLLVTNSALLSSSDPGGGAILTNSWAQIAQAGSADTLITMATSLAALINQDSTLSKWISASASGAVITINNLLNNTIYLQSYTGNGGVGIREIGRRERHMQMVIWSPTEDIRLAIVSAVESMLQKLETNFGLTLPDGTGGRLFNQNDFDLEDATLADTYRHDFLFSVDYPITENDLLYSVLAPTVQYEIQ